LEKTDGAREKRPFAEQLERLWGQALMTVSLAEDEAAKAVHRVAEMAGWSQDEVKRHVRELSERLVSQRHEFERSVEEGVKRALQRLQVPRREEMAAFEERLSRAAARIDELVNRRTPSRPE